MKTTIDGLLAFGIDLRVTGEQMREWEPARIRQFFTGVAMAIDALRWKPLTTEIHLPEATQPQPATGDQHG